MTQIARINIFALALVVTLALGAPVWAEDTGKMAPETATGQQVKLQGVIVHEAVSSLNADSLEVRTASGPDVTVWLNSKTQIKEKKSNPFRSSQKYSAHQLVRGLNVEIKGRNDSSGKFWAEEVKFTDNDFKVAQSIGSRVNPVEGRLAENERNAQRLSGQLEELNELSNAARGGARAAQETADAAMNGVDKASVRIDRADTRITEANDRITSLDDFEVRTSTMIQFKVGNSVLSKDAKAALDTLAGQTKGETGFVIEVTGFASADGSENANRRLSQRRAAAVVQYLAENHLIPLRRIVTPFGYGEKQPVAENTTRAGREQNRRVEVKILVSRGLADSTKGASSSGDGMR
ncbi:MAG: OmpA family protein [Acidobacteriota bacterium]